MATKAKNIEADNAPLEKRTIGRIVHVILRDKNKHLVHRPAIIVRVWRNTAGMLEDALNVQVFTDSENDGLMPMVLMTSVQFDETATYENTWHWPERELEVK